MHGIAYDEIHDEFTVPQQFAQAILTFRGGADGEEAPLRVIQGSRTRLESPARVAVDAVNNEIYVPEGALLVFDRLANGNVAPKRVIEGPDTGLGAGWTPERAGSALTVLRIGSAVAMGRPVAQATMDTAVPAREGQLAVRKGILARERIVVSAPITSDAIKRYRVNTNGQTPNGRTQAIIDDLGKSLFAFSAVRYGRNGSIDPADLNLALENGCTALQRLRFATLWPMRAAGALAQSVGTLRSSMWTR